MLRRGNGPTPSARQRYRERCLLDGLHATEEGLTEEGIAGRCTVSVLENGRGARI